MAIGNNDEGEVKRLMDRLEGAMGRHSPFLIKMKAYWQLKLKNYKEVKRLLSAYIINHPDDLEAGLNLSMAEIQLNENDKARMHLRALQIHHPDHSKIKALLSALPE